MHCTQLIDDWLPQVKDNERRRELIGHATDAQMGNYASRHLARCLLAMRMGVPPASVFNLVILGLHLYAPFPFSCTNSFSSFVLESFVLIFSAGRFFLESHLRGLFRRSEGHLPLPPLVVLGVSFSIVFLLKNA